MKIILLSIAFLTLASCAGVEGYKPEEMGKALKIMSRQQHNVRVFNATGWNPHYR